MSRYTSAPVRMSEQVKARNRRTIRRNIAHERTRSAQRVQAIMHALGMHEGEALAQAIVRMRERQEALYA